MGRDERAQRRASVLWVPLVALLAGWITWWLPLNAWLSRPLVDLQLRALAPSEPLAGVVLIEIDDASLQALRPRLGSWPFKRDVYALAIEQLRDAGARAIVVDLLLADAREGDASLAATLTRPGAPVVLSAAGLHPIAEALPGPASWARLTLPSASIRALDAEQVAVGMITTPLDSDARLRALPLWHRVEGRRWPSLPLAAWLATRPKASTGALPWPVDLRERVVVPFSDHAGVLPTVPFSTLMLTALHDRPAAALSSLVRDRVVFIGAGAMLGDTVLTPVGPMSGTAALAQAYSALASERVVQPPRPGLDVLWVLLATLPLGWVAWRAWRKGGTAAPWLRAGLLTLLLLGIGVTVLSGWQQQLSQPAAAIIALVTGVVLGTVVRQRALLATQRQLQHEREVADESNRAKSQFLANVSHEIRTPMHAVLGVAELLSHSPLNPEQQRLVNLFRDAGQSLQALLNDLLDVSKVEAGRFDLHPVDFALRPALEAVTGLMSQRATQKGLRFSLEMADDLPHSVHGDAQRLAQALTNLLANAIKFTHQGGVLLSVTRQGDLLRFAVRDSGIGIAPSKLETIFEPFTQADGSVTRHYGGTGLGLTLTRSIARAMGGDVTVTSAPGTGSTFALTAQLPEVEPVTERASSTTATPDGLAGRHLLLAEDNETNVLIFRAMLNGLGLTIDHVGNGALALERALQRHYDVAFVDLQMPAMGGLAMTEALRRAEREQGRRRTPVVALTANAYPADVQRSLDVGCDLHLAKPYSRQQLLGALSQVIASHAVMQPPPGGEAPTQVDAGTPGADSGVARTAAATAPSSSTSNAIDRAGALARLGSLELYRRVCEHAAVFTSQWHTAYDAAATVGDGEQMRRLTHDLKAIAANVGANELARRAADLEGASPDTRPAALAAVRDALPPVIRALSSDAPRG